MKKGGMLGITYEEGDPEYELGIFGGMEFTDFFNIICVNIVELKKRITELEIVINNEETCRMEQLERE